MTFAVQKNAVHLGQALVLSLAALAASPSQAQTPEAPAQKCRMVNIANLDINANHLTVTTDGSVNNDKALMLIDSGTQNTMLTKVEASKLGLSAPAPTGKGKRVAKEAVDNRSQVDEFSIGPIELGKTHILTLQRASDYPEFGALIGADLLFQHDFELSLATHQLKFFNPVGCDGKFIAYWDANAGSVELGSLSATDHRPVIGVEMNGQKMRALVDTAAPVSVINLASAARLGVTPQSAGVKPLKAEGKSTRSVSWTAPFREFAVGDETIKNIKMPMLDLKNVVNADSNTSVPDLILGQDFLRAHHVLFSSSQHQFYFSYLGGSVFNMDVSATQTATQ